MKHQSLSISVPEPCHEKWSEMTPAEKGRHCKSCQKTVFDFTKMPKVKIAEFVTEHNGNLCGRFSSDQLNVELIPPKPSKSWLKYAAIFMGLIPAVGFGQETTKPSTPKNKVPPSEIREYKKMDRSNGKWNQAIPKKGTEKKTPLESREYPEPEITSTGSSFTITGNLEKHESDPTSESINVSTISGFVLDKHTDEAILFGTVAIYRDDKLYTGVETDLDGGFTIEAQEGDYIEASYIGYTPIKVKLEDIDFSKGIVLLLEETYLNGEYIIVGITYQKKENWLKRIWGKFENLIISSRDEAIENRNHQPKKNESKIYHYEPVTIDTTPIENENSFEVEPASIQPQVSIFPNPSNGFFNIQLPNGFEQFVIEVSNMQNEIILRQDQNNFDGRVDLSLYPSGSYVVAVIVSGQLINSQVVVKL